VVALQRVQRSTRDANWGTELEELCLEAWEMLGQETDEAGDVADAMCDVLQDKDCFQLAELVIPDLRGNLSADEVATRGVARQTVLLGTSGVRAKLAAYKLPTQALLTDPGYLEERAVFAQAEFYKACLLLYTYGNLSEEQKQQVKIWMDTRPGASGLRASTAPTQS
jgi:hypothetical protein